MTAFATGLEHLVEKVAAFTNMRPVVAGTPFPRGGMTAPHTWTGGAGQRSQQAGAAYQQHVARQAGDPLMREVNMMGEKNFQQSPQSMPTAAPAAPRAGFLGRAAMPLALGLGGAALAGNLMSGYNEDQTYNNLAYAPVGPNTY
jgi:hypothetical protein